ncbi:hypothetical protein ACFZAU_07175 [Streptomyces sp. NPDC008238]
MTTQYTPISNLPYPQATDAADLPAHLRALAEGVDGRTVMRFGDAASRDAKVTAPVAGMVAWLTTPGRLVQYTGTAWVPVGAVPVFRVNLDGGTTTSTTYAETLADAVGDPMAAAFTAPASGQVIVTVGAYMWSSATYSSFMSATVRRASDNAVFLTTSDDRAALVTNTGRASSSSQFLVTGLTAGAGYTATPAYRSGNAVNTATFDTRFIRIDPLL